MPLSLDGTGSITGIVTVSVSDDLAHVGDVNTKITFPANDTITAETAGSERLRITSGGAVQITGVDDQDNLLVKSNNTHFAVHQDDSDGEVSLRAQDGSGSNNSKYMTFFTNPSGSAAVERLRINSSGKLIIGNNGTTFGNAAVQAFIQHGNTAGESGFSSVDTTSVAEGVGGEIAFHGKYNTGAQDWAYFGHIRGVKENATNGDTACALTFHTRPNATAPIERLRIDSGGNVGVGTNVANDSTGNCQAFKIARPVNGQVRLILQNSATGFGNGAGYHQGIDGSNVFMENRSNGGAIDIATISSNTYASRLRISPEGYVNRPYHPAFCATRNGGSHIQLASSANTDVDFPTKDFDNSNSFNTSNGRFTAPIAGKYYFGVQFYCGFSVTSVRVMHASWRKNGSVSHEADLFGGIGNFGDANMNHYHPTTNAHVMLELAKDDYVTFNTGTNSFIGSGNTYLYATKGSRFFGYLVA